MVLVKLKGIVSDAQRLQIKDSFEEAFKNEKVLLINSELVEIQFINEGKKRCAYCASLNAPENNNCASCGAPL